MDLLHSIRVSSTGLSAHRLKLNVIADNLANAQTTRTEEGGPYRRKMVVFEAAPVKRFGDVLGSKMCGGSVKCESEYDQASCHTCEDPLPELDAAGVEVTKIVKSQEDFALIYNPSHPDADPVTGYVAMPNVDILAEMADMVVARRAYDASAAAIGNAKAMIIKALEIGK